MKTRHLSIILVSFSFICPTLLVAQEIDQGFYVGKLTFPKECEGNAPIAELTRLAKDGHPFAQHDLGVIYNNGQSVSKSYEEAVKWFAKPSNRAVLLRLPVGIPFANRGS